MALARPPASGDRKHQPDIARIDFLLLGDSDRPLQAARVEPLAERRGQAIACIRQHRRKPNASGADAVDLGQRNLRLRPRRPPVLGHAGLRHPVGGAGPALRQKQAQADHHRNLVPRQRQRHQRLAIGGLAERRGVLRRDPDRMRALLRQRRVVDDKDCAGAPDQLVRLDREFLFQPRFVPDAARNEMMQLVVVAGRPSRRHRLDALALARPNQPSNVERTHPSTRLVSEPRQERRKPPIKIPAPLRHAAGSPNPRADQRSKSFPNS
jgi:hypothetical protein